MIKITEEQFIAEGTFQKCYHHPINKDLCVKISKSKIEDTRLFNEIKYYRKISRKKANKFEYPFFAKYYGEEITNIGAGYIFKLIRDESTQDISKTFEYYLKFPNPNISDDMLIKGFERLVLQMIKHKIIANDLRSKNIFCKILKDKTIQLILIDGVGHRDFLPLVDWFSFFAKKKIHRRISKYKLNNLEEQRIYIKEMESW